MWILSVLILILILGVIILVHEFGHFIWAKIFKVHIYEFSIGMGPIIFKHKGKDKIDYNLRAIPIGGFVAMAGEVYEDADTKKIPKDKFMCNKPWWQRLIILVAGVVNNFILALVLLFVSALIWGSSTLKPLVHETIPGYPMHTAGVKSGDVIVAVNDHKVKTWDVAQIVLAMKNKTEASYYFLETEYEDGSSISLPIVLSENIAKIELESSDEENNTFYIINKDGTTKELVIPLIKVSDLNNNVIGIKKSEISSPKSTPVWKFDVKDQNGNVRTVTIPQATEKTNDGESKVFGIMVGGEAVKGFGSSLKYAFQKFASVWSSMWLTITGLITGKISIKALSGPVGMYQVVDQARTIGIDYLIYITAFLSLNVGFINILPFPAFDGGHVFFIIVEKIKGSPVDSKFENICHTIGFILLLMLMIVITIQDVVRLF